MSNAPRIPICEIKPRVTQALVNKGCSTSLAEVVADDLIAAEAEGNVAHGLARLDYYLAQLETGKINPNPKITTTHPTKATLWTDADCGFAYPAIDSAIAPLCTKALEYGIASAAIFNSHHCGSLGVQVEKVAKRGLIAIMVANTPKAMSSFGSSELIFGTNPIAFATSVAHDSPLVIDLSLSQIARGKIIQAQKNNELIADGCALDKDGKPTTDPSSALAGSLLPIGGTKGGALALMVEILAAAHTGSQFSYEADSFFTPTGEPPRVGQFILAIKPNEILDGIANPNYEARLTELLQKIASIDGIRLPGERRKKAKKEAETFGIPIPENHWLFAELNENLTLEMNPS